MGLPPTLRKALRLGLLQRPSTPHCTTPHHATPLCRVAGLDRQPPPHQEDWTHNPGEETQTRSEHRGWTAPRCRAAPPHPTPIDTVSKVLEKDSNLSPAPLLILLRLRGEECKRTELLVSVSFGNTGGLAVGKARLAGTRDAGQHAVMQGWHHTPSCMGHTLAMPSTPKAGRVGRDGSTGTKPGCPGSEEVDAAEAEQLQQHTIRPPPRPVLQS